MLVIRTMHWTMARSVFYSRSWSATDPQGLPAPETRGENMSSGFEVSVPPTKYLRSDGMSASPQQRKKPSLAKRLSRLVVRLRDPEWLRYGKLLLLGKALGVGMVLLLITLVSGL